jgi:two-component system sensor histidine kinase DesK
MARQHGGFANPFGPGEHPEHRRQLFVKLCWTVIWLLYLAAPITNLLKHQYSVGAEILGWISLALFLTCYAAMIFRGRDNGYFPGWATFALGGMTTTAVAASLMLDGVWLTLFVYCGVCAGVVLPLRVSAWVIPGLAVLLVAVGLRGGADHSTVFALAIPTLLAGFAMTGLQRLMRTLRELREARKTIARLAASDERLRLARDLHDLLGHSLSLITLKSELAGRLLSERPEDAAQQVADIERVSRQALADVREAVSGYRRTTLAVELAGSRVALDTAGITADTTPALERIATGPEEGRLFHEEEAALGWALREAVTNVIRHSGARRCRLDVREVLGEGGRPMLCLEVSDDGRAARSAKGVKGVKGVKAGQIQPPVPGNGLTGLQERLLLVDGELSAAPGPEGFLLLASVPLRNPRAALPEQVGPAEQVRPAEQSGLPGQPAEATPTRRTR